MNKKISECYESICKYNNLQKSINEEIGLFIPSHIEYNIVWLHGVDCMGIRIFIGSNIHLKHINQISSYIGVMPLIKADSNDIIIDYVIQK